MGFLCALRGSKLRIIQMLVAVAASEVRHAAAHPDTTV
jgi:hypothetical protein